MTHWRRGARVGAVVVAALALLQVALVVLDRFVPAGGEGGVEVEAPLLPRAAEIGAGLLALLLVFAVVTVVATVVIDVRERRR